MNKTTESVRKDLEGGDVGEDITGSDGNVASEILKKLDANSYATKKTIAQGLLDVALLTANASQLKYILQVGEQHEFYHLMLGLIITSIILQIIQAIVCVFVGSSININKAEEQDNANLANNSILALNILLVIVNVLIAGFEMKEDYGHLVDTTAATTTTTITPLKFSMPH
ncbi:ninjurin-2 isoform X1 [Onthophagus taurus]|uniref:ninjurin-2 isoform X1 n=1 Tax=Onthophagus taurus TaxID=166361 RepID=UPI0039BE447E